MKCDFEKTKLEGGWHFKCRRCGFEALKQAEEYVHRCFRRGLGDTVAALASAVGIETCESCEERRAKLNRMFPYAG